MYFSQFPNKDGARAVGIPLITQGPMECQDCPSARVISIGSASDPAWNSGNFLASSDEAESFSIAFPYALEILIILERTTSGL